MNRILTYIEIGRQEGAQVVTGGARHGDRGTYRTHGLAASATRCASRRRKSSAVATVIPFRDDDDAIRLANGTVYSLAAGVWTADDPRASLHLQAEAGTVWVNTYGPT